MLGYEKNFFCWNLKKCLKGYYLNFEGTSCKRECGDGFVIEEKEEKCVEKCEFG